MVRNFDELKNRLKIMKKINNWSLESTVQKFLSDNAINYTLNYQYDNEIFEIYLDDYKVAIDLCYVDIHNEQHLSMYYDFYTIKTSMHNKVIHCKKLGIHHIFIWDYMWNNKRQRNILQSLILNCCNKSKNKIMARNTYIKVERAYDLKDFFTQNNIQGYRVAKDAISLYDKYTNELLMSYAIGHAYFGKGKYDLEIVRGACKLGYHIIGGTSKLWKYIVNEYAPNKSIVYYVDLNYFNGRSLDKLCEQFKDMKYIASKYSFKNWYIEEQQMRNRDPKKHQKIKELIDAGFIKTCWDAGSLVYVYNKELSK